MGTEMVGSGSTWSVDIEGTRTLLSVVDGGAEEFCAAAAETATAADALVAAMAGSSVVRGALSGFFGEREDVPARVVSRVRASAGAVITGVEAVSFADESMATEQPAVDDNASPLFSASRFGSAAVPQ